MARLLIDVQHHEAPDVEELHGRAGGLGISTGWMLLKYAHSKWPSEVPDSPRPGGALAELQKFGGLPIFPWCPALKATQLRA